MAKAIWNGAVLAESSETRVVEGNHYFPRASLDAALFEDSDHHTFCGWKGQADYFHLNVGGERLENAAWTYPSTSDAAKQIEGWVAFYRGKGVTVEG